MAITMKAKWISELAGDYIENWVPELVAAEWQKEVVNLQSRIAELEAENERLRDLADTSPPDEKI